ncbi:hypothetical protein Tco_0351423 [Tanacetum coccineum]
MNTTQAQQKALDDALVAPVDRLEFRKCNMRLKTDIKPKEATFQVVLDALSLTPFYRAFLIIIDVPAIYIDLGHTGDITYLNDVNVDYLHQPWRAFSTVINKFLSGKETGMDKIHLLFQIEYKDAKKTNKMSYPRFTKIIIDYFMLKDPSISRRNKMFWHTARDDTLFTSMRCISRHEDTQVYGTILLTEVTNQAMLESKAYQTYYAFASGEKAPKPKYIRKKADSDTSPKKKLVQATTKGDGVDTQSKVPDEQQAKTSGTDEGTDSDDEDNDDDDGDNDDDGDSDDHDDDSDDERIEFDRDEIPDPKLTNVDQTEHEEEELDDEFYE